MNPLYELRDEVFRNKCVSTSWNMHKSFQINCPKNYSAQPSQFMTATLCPDSSTSKLYELADVYEHDLETFEVVRTEDKNRKEPF